MLKRSLLILLLCVTSHTASATRFDHVIWDELLREHVYMINQGQASRVHYAGFALYHGQLRKYLDQLAKVRKDDFLDWDKPEQLAFLINAYNASTVEMVLRSYSSIATLRAFAPVTFSWKFRLISMLKNQRELNFISQFGEILSLNDLEEGMIRRPGNYDEPRIHFALNRASIDYPALRNRAYTGIEGGLQALPGTYKLVMMYGGGSDSTFITVKDVPRLGIRNDIKLAQRKMYDRLRRSSDKLTTGMDQLTEGDEVITKVLAQIKGVEGKEVDSLRKVSTKLQDDIRIPP